MSRRYEFLSPLLYRAPIFSLRQVLECIDNNKELSLLEEPFVRTALFLANPQFYERLTQRIKIKEGTGPLTSKDLQTLRRYLLRMASKPTPFGFFSGIGVGSIGNETKIPQDLLNKARYNLFESTSAIHRRKKQAMTLSNSLISDLEFMINPSLYFKELVANFWTRLPHENGFHDVSIKIHLSKFIKNKLIQFPQKVSLKQAKELLNQNNLKTKSTVEQIIFNLVRNQILIPVEVNQAPSCLWSKESLPPFSELKKIMNGWGKSSFEFDLPWNAGIELQEPLQLQKNKAENLLKVITQFADFFSERTRTDFLASDWKIEAIREYLHKNYAGQTFPLLELTEEMLTPYRPELSKELQLSPIDIFLQNRTEEILMSKSTEWKINENDLQRFHQIHKESGTVTEWPKVISILLAAATKRDQLFLIPKKIFHQSASRLMARAAAWSANIRQVNQLVLQEEVAKSSGLSAQLFHRSARASVDNVRNLALDLPFFIDMDGVEDQGSTQIPISEVGLRLAFGGEVKLVRMNTEQEIHLFSVDAHGARNEPNFHFRLLNQFSRIPHSPIFIWRWGPLEKLKPFLPRVSYGQVILAPAQWQFFYEGSREASSSRLDQCLRCHQLPKLCYLVTNRGRILIDTERAWAKELMVHELIKSGQIQFQECIESESERPLELLLFAKTQINELATNQIVNRLNCSGPSFLPTSDDCLFLKIYHSEENSQVVLKSLKKIILGQASFFIRSQDPEYHLRIRFFFDKKGQKKKIESQIHRILSSLMKERLIWRVETATYFPEYERYCGLIGVKLFERISISDSRIVLRLLESDGDLIGGAQLGLHWLNFFSDSIEENIILIRNMIDLYLDRKKIKCAIKPLTQIPFSLIKNIENTSLKNDVRNYLKKLSDDDKKRFIHSVIHLSINRWSPRSRKEMEIVILKSLQHHLYQQVNRAKNAID